jgi:hypothetical protein
VQLQPQVDALRKTRLEHAVLHADEIPVSRLAPSKKKTYRAFVGAYCTTPFSDLKTVVYDFSPTRAGEHARTFLGETGKTSRSAAITRVSRLAAATASPKSVAWPMLDASSMTSTRPIIAIWRRRP